MTPAQLRAEIGYVDPPAALALPDHMHDRDGVAWIALRTWFEAQGIEDTYGALCVYCAETFEVDLFKAEDIYADYDGNVEIGYGNAIVAPLAAEFIGAFMDTEADDVLPKAGVEPKHVLVVTVFVEHEGGQWLTNGQYSRHETADDAELHALVARLAGPGISITVTDRENERDGQVAMGEKELTWFSDEAAS